MGEDMKAADILKRAKARIEDPKRWTRNAYARDADGKECDPDSDIATCFCAIGAVANVIGVRAGEAERAPAIEPLYKAAGAHLDWWEGPNKVTDVNDNDTHTAVMKLFDEAIAIAESEDA
jgi:hypothetical protein